MNDKESWQEMYAREEKMREMSEKAGGVSAGDVAESLFGCVSALVMLVAWGGFFVFCVWVALKVLGQ